MRRGREILRVTEDGVIAAVAVGFAALAGPVFSLIRNVVSVGDARHARDWRVWLAILDSVGLSNDLGLLGR
jgi:hypothetical protein